MPKTDYVRRILAILELLRTETDHEHRLNSREIARLMEERHQLAIDPRSVRSIIETLADGGFPLDTDSKYCFSGVFSEGEREYLAQAIKYGSGITREQRAECCES